MMAKEGSVIRRLMEKIAEGFCAASAGLVFALFLIGCVCISPFIFLFEGCFGGEVEWFDSLAGRGY